jgi:uncharacterized protein (TIGR00369 family)
VTEPDDKQTAFLYDAMPFARVLGVEALASEPGEVRARVAWQADRCTSGGALHGGVLMGLADVCGGACAFTNLPEGATGTTTIESKTNFFRAVREGSVEAIARPLHVGRTTIVVETDLFDDAGKRVARVTQTQAVLR